MLYHITRNNYKEISQDILDIMYSNLPIEWYELFEENGQLSEENLAKHIESNELEYWEAKVTRLYLDAIYSTRHLAADFDLNFVWEIVFDRILYCFSLDDFTLCDSENIYEVLDLSVYEEITDYDLDRGYLDKNYYFDYKDSIWVLTFTESSWADWRNQDTCFEDTGKTYIEKCFRYDCKEN